MKLTIYSDPCPEKVRSFIVKTFLELHSNTVLEHHPKQLK